MAENRKRVKHYHRPGDLHELTFSCYRGLPLLSSDAWCGYLADAITAACEAHDFELNAFVFMPNHVHLLVCPLLSDGVEDAIPRFLAAVKRPTSVRAKIDLEHANSPLLRELVVRERPGREVFRFWQEGPGYDRNIEQDQSLAAAIEYIHLNPVRKGLCERSVDWYWSSALWFLSDTADSDQRLPRLSKLPIGYRS